MIKFFESDTLFQNVSSWADHADEKLRVWWQKQSQDVRTQLNRTPAQWSALAKEQARVLDIDWVNLGKLKTSLDSSSFDAKVKAGGSMYRTYIKAARHWLGAEVFEVELEAGPIHYWVADKGHPETILFLHGFADSKDGAYALAHHLIKDFNVIALDLPGFGDSFRHPELMYNSESYGKWLDEFINKSGIGAVHVVGNSLGGAMALKLALVRPDIVKSLSLLNTAAIIDFNHESIYDEILLGINLFQVRTLDQFEEFWAKVFHRQPFLPPFVKEFLFHQFRENHDWYGQLVDQTFGGHTDKSDPEYFRLFMNEHLHKVNAPSLIIWGDRDKLFPVAYGRKGHALLKNSSFVLLNDVGHAPQVEAPQLVAKHMKTFIRNLPLQDTKAEPSSL